MLEPFRQETPLPCLLMGVLERCFSAERLDALFDEHAQTQYSREITFSALVALVMKVVLKVHPSVNAAHQKSQIPPAFTVSALYEKLKGVELAVSRALLVETAMDLSGILDTLRGKPALWLPGYSIRILDGNCLAASQKRLAVHKGVAGAALPGKSLVVFDPERNLMLDVFQCEDGEAQERRLLGETARTARPGELWVDDRNFCTLGFLDALARNGAHTLVRQHGNLPFTEKTPFAQVSEGGGRRVSEQLVEVGGREYRRVRVELENPTRDGDMALYLITDLPADVGADTVAWLYRRRWDIEISFQKVEKYYNSEIETLAYPKAALFGFALALVAYNIFSVMIAALDAAHEKPVSEGISGYYIAADIAATFLALLRVVPARDWDFIARQTPAEFAGWLRETARNVPLRTLKKHKRGPKKPADKAPYDPKQPHFSTYQLLANKG
jgi:hypothetical protein